jgi:uroporphyrinogen decarboxylase
MAEELTSRQRVRLAIDRKEPDRVPKADAPWGATIRRWRSEGLPEDKDPSEHFGFDMRSVGADLSPRLPVRVLEENEEYVITSTPTGGKRRNHRDFSTTPEVIECPIKTQDDWPRIRARLQPDFKRLDWASVVRNTARWREEGLYIVFGAASGYDCLQSYVRSEDLLAFMATDPQFVKDMVDTLADLILATMNMLVEEGVEFDALWLYNDMGYRNALLFSPQMYRDIIQPADTRLWGRAHELGRQTILHSCGCVKELIPDLIEAGLDCLQPLEVKAGMDVRELKGAYGDQIAFFGNIDVRLMEDPDVTKIETEIREKFAVAKPGGGYLYHSDHSIPKDVSFERYSHVMQLVDAHGRY